jgi:hypothetical protein
MEQVMKRTRDVVASVDYNKNQAWRTFDNPLTNAVGQLVELNTIQVLELLVHGLSVGHP